MQFGRDEFIWTWSGPDRAVTTETRHPFGTLTFLPLKKQTKKLPRNCFLVAAERTVDSIAALRRRKQLENYGNDKAISLPTTSWDAPLKKKHQTATVGSRPHGWRRPGAKLARLAHTWLIITQIASIRFYFLWGTGKVLPSVKPRIGRRVGATSTDDRRWPMAPCSREELSRRHHCPHKERKNHGVLPSFFMILLSFVEFTRRPDIQSLRSKNRPLATRSPLEWWWQHYFPRTEHSLVSEGQLNKPPCPFPHFHRVPLHHHDFTVSCSKFRIIVIYAPSTTSLMSYIKCASNVQQRISSRR